MAVLHGRLARSLVPLISFITCLPACDGARPLALTSTRPPTRIRGDIVADTLGSYSIPTPNGAEDANGSPLRGTSTGIIIPAGKLYYLYAGGTISVSANSNYTCCLDWGSFPIPESGATIGPLGYPDSFGLVDAGLLLEGGATLFPFTSDATSPVQTDTLSNTSDHTVTVARGPLNGSSASCSAGPNGCTCPDGPCDFYSATAYTFAGSSGEFLRVIVASNPTLTVSATPDTVPSDDPQVKFTATVTPATWGSHTFPLSINSWTYHGGTASCGFARSCTTDVSASGWMVLDATVNGSELIDSVNVVVQ